VSAEALGDPTAIAAKLDNRVYGNDGAPTPVASAAGVLERLADVPIYATDSLVRRAPALLQTADARGPFASLSASLWTSLGLAAGDRVRIAQGGGHAVLVARLDPTLAENVVRVPAGHAATAALGAMFGTLTVAKA
jgi:NADH-quinone oxidoreductase subunit G